MTLICHNCALHTQLHTPSGACETVRKHSKRRESTSSDWQQLQLWIRIRPRYLPRPNYISVKLNHDERYREDNACGFRVPRNCLNHQLDDTVPVGCPKDSPRASKSSSPSWAGYSWGIEISAEIIQLCIPKISVFLTEGSSCITRNHKHQHNQLLYKSYELVVAQYSSHKMIHKNN